MITPVPTLVKTSHSSKIDRCFNHPVMGVLFVFLAGALLALAFSPVGFYPLAVLSPIILFYRFLSATPRQAAWSGYCFGLGFFGVGVSWVFVAIHVFGLTSVLLAAVLTFISVSVLAACIALQGYLSILFVQKFNIVSLPVRVILVFPLFWILLEWFRGWFMTGFPWLNLGYSQTDTLLSGYAAVFGVYGVSWFVVLSSALLLAIIVHYTRKSVMLLSLVGIWSVGGLLTQINWTEETGEPLKVSLVQGNVEQINKWDPEHFIKRKDRYLSLTQKHWDSDLVIWPENSLTIFYHQLEDGILSQLAVEAKKQNTAIILGLPVLNRDTDEYFSTLMTIEKDKKNSFYYKTHLVPFGEFIPLASLLRGLINFFDLPMSGFTPGSHEQKLLTAAGQKIAPTICYEDAFGEELIRFLPEATLIINASNNAWYGDSFAPHQHLQISRMRALETGRDVMRVTTNGISALIDHQGKIKSRSPQFKSYVVTGLVQPRTGVTPYVLWGNYFILLLIFSGLAGSVFYPRYKQR